MYGTFYGFNEPAFSPQPDVRFLYLNEDRRRVLETVEFAVRERAGFCVISARAGLGKTILIPALIQRLGDHVHAGLVTCTPDSTPGLPELVAAAFKIELSNTSTSEAYRRIKDYIANLRRDGKCALLIIDNAHNLTLPTFKLLVHLGDIDDSLQVVLVGHPELKRQFSRQALGDAAPRAIIQCELSEFNMLETDAYIRRRVVTAGGAADLFSPSAIKTVYQYSRGVPALINCACNFALEAGYEGKRQIIDDTLVSDILESPDDDALELTEEQQRTTAAPGTAPDITRVEQDISDFIRLSFKHQRQHNRRLGYAILTTIIVPATAILWLLFQLRPGDRMGQGVETPIADNRQPVKEQFDAASSDSLIGEPAIVVSTSPSQTHPGSPPLLSPPAESELTDEHGKLEKIQALNSLKATQRQLERRLVEQRAEQGLIREKIQSENDRILEARSQLDQTFEQEATPMTSAGIQPAIQSEGSTQFEDAGRQAMIAELKQKQLEMERRIAVQRFEYNRIKAEIEKENERIVKARALIKRAYRSARFIWNQVYKATPEPYPEDPEER